AREFQRVVDRAPDASLVVLVTGARTEFADLQRGRATLPSNVNLLVIRVATGAPVALRTAGTVVELTVGTLVDLPRALRGGVR
ncbi:MAG: hypothetical protein LBI33_08745, partial [Propionibacteriaceae bacterium]|nr:hypothetical protein [Propionibacteriaceae bacterium]